MRPGIDGCGVCGVIELGEVFGGGRVKWVWLLGRVCWCEWYISFMGERVGVVSRSKRGTMS